METVSDYRGWDDTELGDLLEAYRAANGPRERFKHKIYQIEAELHRRSTGITLSIDTNDRLIMKCNGVARLVYVHRKRKLFDARGLA